MNKLSLYIFCICIVEKPQIRLFTSLKIAVWWVCLKCYYLFSFLLPLTDLFQGTLFIFLCLILHFYFHVFMRGRQKTASLTKSVTLTRILGQYIVVMCLPNLHAIKLVQNKPPSAIIQVRCQNRSNRSLFSLFSLCDHLFCLTLSHVHRTKYAAELSCFFPHPQLVSFSIKTSILEASIYFEIYSLQSYHHCSYYPVIPAQNKPVKGLLMDACMLLTKYVMLFIRAML